MTQTKQQSPESMKGSRKQNRETIEKTATEARRAVKDLDRQIAELQDRRVRAKADADRLTKLLIKTWGMGTGR